MNWERHWHNFPAAAGEQDFLRQVGKTLHGQPISSAQFSLLLEEVMQLLDLRPHDSLLDLCCGNGLITARIAENCRFVAGVDYSTPLIRIANKFHARPNIAYHLGSVLDLANLPQAAWSPINKAYMYEALQHFTPSQLEVLLETLHVNCPALERIVFFSVPDRAFRWRFYNNPRRKLVYLLRTISATEQIGTWWDRAALQRTASRHGYRCRFFPQPPGLHTSHYRMDVVFQDRSSHV